MRRVVITAAQTVTAAGIGRERLSQGLQDNSCFGKPSGYSLPIQKVARITEEMDIPIEVQEYFVDDRKSWLGWLAADLAWKEANYEGIEIAPNTRRAVFVGTGLSSITPYEMNEDIYAHVQDTKFDKRAMALDITPHKAAPNRHMPHHFASYLSTIYGARVSGSNFSACAAAAQAIASGFWSVRRGEVDLALVGGHDSMDHPMGLLSFVVLGALSPTSCSPFDMHRNGFMLGEGAGMLVLESLEHAQNRGAKILAEIIGAGTSMDAWNPTAPHPEGKGAEKAMRRALKDAGIGTEEIDYVNAHGTGTSLGDVAETMAISRVFGEQMKVSSIKGAVGHCIAAAGVVEAVACVSALQEGWLPGTVGFSEKDPMCPVEIIEKTIYQHSRCVLSNSFGFGGQNCSLIFTKWEEESAVG